MEKSKEMQRRAARAMKRAMHQGVDPYDTAKTQGKVYKRLCREDIRRKPWTVSDALEQWRETHEHKFDWDGSQTCECGAKFF